MLISINMNISYHALFLFITYIIRLTPFDFFKAKWLNSEIFLSYMDTRTKVYM